MAWSDFERDYYFGNPFADEWDVALFRQRYIGDRPLGLDPTVNEPAAVTRRICQTLFRLSQQLCLAAHRMRGDCSAVGITALRGNALNFHWPNCLLVTRGSDLDMNQGQANNESVYIGIPITAEGVGPNASLRQIAHPDFSFFEVTDEMLAAPGNLPIVDIPLQNLQDRHAAVVSDAVSRFHPDRHCIVPADQLPANGPGPEDRYIMEINTILYGPPGTGKTFATTALALAVIEPAVGGAAGYAQGLLGAASDQTAPKIDESDWKAWINEFEDLRAEGRIEFTTFHQNYAYEDFIEGIRPEVKDERVHYRVEPGVLKRIAYRALYAWITGEVAPVDDAGKKKVEERVSKWLLDEEIDEEEAKKSEKDAPKYLLIIDEINRGNVSRILGELITLIEDSKRARRNPLPGQQPLKVTLPYSKEPFILPPNLYLLGTMNTADRSLVGLDHALRRRFSFEELEPKPELLKNRVTGVELDRFLTTLNERIEEHLDRDHRIGHAFLMDPTNMEGLARAMRKKVIPQLMEYFHDSPNLLAKVLQGTGFVEFDSPHNPQRVKAVIKESKFKESARYAFEATT